MIITKRRAIRETFIKCDMPHCRGKDTEYGFGHMGHCKNCGLDFCIKTNRDGKTYKHDGFSGILFWGELCPDCSKLHNLGIDDDLLIIIPKNTDGILIGANNQYLPCPHFGFA